jgi:hypothetical protein
VKSGTASADIAVCPAGILYKASVNVMGAVLAVRSNVSEVSRRPSIGPDTMVCPLQKVPKSSAKLSINPDGDDRLSNAVTSLQCLQGVSGTFRLAMRQVLRPVGCAGGKRVAATAPGACLCLQSKGATHLCAWDTLATVSSKKSPAGINGKGAPPASWLLGRNSLQPTRQTSPVIEWPLLPPPP